MRISGGVNPAPILGAASYPSNAVTATPDYEGHAGTHQQLTAMFESLKTSFDFRIRAESLKKSPHRLLCLPKKRH